MRLRQQVRRAWGWGSLTLLVGLLLGVLAVMLEIGTMRLLPDILAGLAMLMLAAGALCCLGGGLLRPAQVWAFRHGMPAGRIRAFSLRRAWLRWWLWVDEDGRDRDVG